MAELRLLLRESIREQGTAPILMVNPSTVGAIHGEGAVVETEPPKLPKTNSCEAEEHEFSDAEASRSSSSSPSESSSSSETGSKSLSPQRSDTMLLQVYILLQLYILLQTSLTYISNNFRPIALANFQFKIVTKILAERLAIISMRIVSPIKEVLSVTVTFPTVSF